MDEPRHREAVLQEDKCGVGVDLDEPALQSLEGVVLGPKSRRNRLLVDGGTEEAEFLVLQDSEAGHDFAELVNRCPGLQR